MGASRRPAIPRARKALTNRAQPESRLAFPGAQMSAATDLADLIERGKLALRGGAPPEHQAGAHIVRDVRYLTDDESKLICTALRSIDTINQMRRDLETGFMDGAYARLKNLQVAECELARLKGNIASLKDACADLSLVIMAFGKDRGTPDAEIA